MRDVRICSIKTNGPIEELGNITGPIHRCKLEVPTIISMIHHGHKIYELNPDNLDESVLLDITNIVPSPFAKEKSMKPAPVQLVNIVKEEESKGEEAEPVADFNDVKEEEEELETDEETLNEEEVETPNTQSNTNVVNNNYQNNRNGKKNKHNKHKNQNNQYKPVVNTMEEKVVTSDF